MLHEHMNPTSYSDYVLFVYAASSAHAQLFQCQPSEDDVYGQVFPNIPDMYFDSAQAADSLTGPTPDLTALVSNIAYIFTVPLMGANRNCSGNVVAFEYCYQSESMRAAGSRPVFEFLRLTRNSPISQSQSFTVDSRFPVRDSTVTCVDIAGTTDQVCCSVSDLSEQNQHEAPTTAYTVGVEVNNANIRPLALADRLTQFHISQYQIALANNQLPSTFIGSVLTGRSIPQLRFYLGKHTVSESEND